MKTITLTVVVLILSAMTIFLFFGRVDSAMEVDSLKEQIKLQRKEMHFLQSITNGAFFSCKSTVAEFEESARANGHQVLWQGDDALVGAFRVKRKDSCIVSIEVISGF